ncbi:Multicopper oxidase type 2 [Penicillium odoratum]|uniref:Multicopper oxidase type 2 n=1 Tax=Penicillium odoratum TaxID=1167516 RepID=UPI002548A36E|nr:Multicopper oxidase type 2 [Penicillium odoratum]KAJ5759775.1 Multicopper oxidase type 2 [Penicillium odoratum]
MAPLKLLLALASSALTQLAAAKLVQFDLDLTWQKGAPDGNVREMVFMNGQFPGPELRLDQGDDVEVTVHNNLPFNTSIHFHGIEQLDTPWSDGVPGVTQKPIEPGRNWTYRWKATQYGTYWYHSHGRAELMDGLYGPIWINPAPETPNPFHLISSDPADIEAMHRAEKNPQLIMLSDWDHLTFEQYQKVQEDSHMAVFCMDSVLINGRGAVYCPGSEKISSVEQGFLKSAMSYTPLTDKGCLPNLYTTQGDFPPHDETRIPQGVTWGCNPTTGSHEIIEVDGNAGWVSFKFISAAALKALIFSIDEHPMYIYEVDGSYVEPMLVDASSIYTGERYAAMIKLDKPWKDYTIRVPDTQGDQIISGFATMRYKGSTNTEPSLPYVNYGGVNTSASVVFMDNQAIHPYPAVTIPARADQLVNLTLGRSGSSYTFSTSGGPLWDHMVNMDDPILYDINAKNNLAPELIIETKNGSWVDVLLQLGQFPHTGEHSGPHVMHKHSNKAFILGAGPGYFKWANTEEAIAEHPEYFEIENPAMRDTFVTQGSRGIAWVMIRYQVINPGPFIFHCHLETHMANGMAVTFLDGVDAWPQLPAGEDQSPNPVLIPIPVTTSTSIPVASPTSLAKSSSTPLAKPSAFSSQLSRPSVQPDTPSAQPSTFSSKPYTPTVQPYTFSPQPYTPSAQPYPYFEPPSPTWQAREEKAERASRMRRRSESKGTQEQHKPFRHEVTLIEEKEIRKNVAKQPQ